jgi:hypothetical protein
LLNVFIIHKSFLVESSGSFKYRIIWTENGKKLDFFLSYLYLFFSFTCPIILAEYSSLTLTWVERMGIFILFFFFFLRKCFQFSPFSTIWPIGLLYTDFLMLRYVPFYS